VKKILSTLLAVAFVVTVVGNIAALLAALLVVGLALTKLLLGSRDQAEIVLGVLVVVFGRNRIPGALCVTGELEIFLGDVRCGPANFHIRSIGLIHTRQWILVMTTTLAVATPHALVLTVSHGLLFCQPPSCAAATPLLFLIGWFLPEKIISSCWIRAIAGEAMDGSCAIISCAMIVEMRWRPRIDSSADSSQMLRAKVTRPAPADPRHRSRGRDANFGHALVSHEYAPAR